MSVANKNCPPHALRDILRIIRAAATTHSPRASGADDDVLSGCRRDRLRTILARISTPFTGITATSSV
jgi:hypothetical protein